MIVFAFAFAPRPHTPMRALVASCARLTHARATERARTTSRPRAMASSDRMTRVDVDVVTNAYVDTHCHMDAVLARLNVDSIEDYLALADAFDASSTSTFEGCVTVGCSSASFESTRAVARAGGDRVRAAYGVHPLSAEEWRRDDVRARVRELLTSEPRVVAVGETGLDYHRLPDAGPEAVAAYKLAQKEAFAAQMALANELNKPLIVHTREAEEDTLEMMKAHLPSDARVHVHCFTSSANLARGLLEAFPTNLCLGFTGVATFKNGQDVRDVIAQVPLDKILLETDAPYMAPTPFRGQTCHPAMVPRIAAAIARVHDVDDSVVFEKCRANTRRVYGI